VNEKDIKAALKTGADAFIPKPVEREKLLAAIAEWLAKAAQGITGEDNSASLP
jgi:CheY-like chemotaxis protein